jgi:hypothetical protein
MNSCSIYWIVNFVMLLSDPGKRTVEALRLLVSLIVVAAHQIVFYTYHPRWLFDFQAYVGRFFAEEAACLFDGENVWEVEPAIGSDALVTVGGHGRSCQPYRLRPRNSAGGEV